jgi:hypothetical protein
VLGEACQQHVPSLVARGDAACNEGGFGPFGPTFAMDQPASSARTRDALRWQPTHLSLLEDLENLYP